MSGNFVEAPDFSIVVPTYNRPDELAHCLKVLSALDYPKDRFEVIVVDDGSDEPAESVVARWSDKLRIQCLRQGNGGPGVARNTGVQAAMGRFIAFTDDDCDPKPDWLTQLRKVLDDDPDAMVGGLTVNTLEDNPYTTTSQVIVDLVYDFYNEQAGQSTFFATNNMALAADPFRALGGFDPRFRASEDRDLCDRWTASGRRMVHAPEAVIRHAHHLDFVTFWRQHISYGRGARRYYLAHKNRDNTTSTIKGDFYWELLQRVPRALKGRKQPLYVLFLLFVWQLANATGFVLEAFFPGRGSEE